MSDTKRCSTCGVVKPLDEFHLDRARQDRRQNNCKACNIAINKQWYRDHPEAREQRMDSYARKRTREGQEFVLGYLLTHPCVDCGETDPVVLEFDHLRDKVKNVSAMLRGRLSRLIAEIEKCEVVCANCHRRRTAARLQSFRFLAVLDDEWGRWDSDPQPSG